MSETRLLLDTSIQIKRILSNKWRAAGHDSVWNEVTPCTSHYLWMEFKRSVIGALEFLARTISEARDDAMPNAAAVRLSEVLNLLTIDTTTITGDRRLRLACAFAAKLFSEIERFDKPRSVAYVLRQIRVEAENLEKVLFFHYSRNGAPNHMQLVDTVKCDLGATMSPLRGGLGKYTCCKKKLSCEILKMVEKSGFRAIAAAVSTGEIRFHSSRFRDGVMALKEALDDGTLVDGQSIGQTLCFPVGDYIIVSEAFMHQIGIFSADRDQITLGSYFKVMRLYYDQRDEIFIPNT